MRIVIISFQGYFASKNFEFQHLTTLSLISLCSLIHDKTFSALSLEWVHWLECSNDPARFLFQRGAKKMQQQQNHLAADVPLPQDKDWNLQERMQYYRLPGLMERAGCGLDSASGSEC